MEHSGSPGKILPPNAYTPLQPGEVYRPVVPATASVPEVTLRSFLYGLILTIVFAFAAAFIGFKTGNAIETAIPIAILAVFFGKLHARKNSLLENVIIQSMGQASGVVVAGAGFTIPALYINELDPNLFHAFLACMGGGFLGILLLIPLRRYFVRDLHGQLPFPEATATNEILVTGQQSGGSAGKILLTAFGIGFVYEFLAETVHAWNTALTTKALNTFDWARNLFARGFEIRMNAIAATFGLGYIIGLRYAAIIAGGSVLANLVLVPLLAHFAGDLTAPIHPAEELVSQMAPEDIWATYVRPIGIGTIAVAGMLGIMKMSKIIFGSMLLGFKGIFGGGGGGQHERTDRDIHPALVLLLELVMAVAIFGLFKVVFQADLNTSIIGAAVVLVLAFLFTPVAARAIAIVGVNPVSGMTLITVIIACLILTKWAGVTGASGQLIVICIGCAVCTALSMSGAFVTDLKIGYWLGATPKKQEWLKFIAIAVAAASVIGVIYVLNQGYGFAIEEGGKMVSNPALPAPQANLIGSIVEGLMANEAQPLLFYALGAVVALLLEMVGVPGLAFGLGLYLPLEINLAVLFGGFVSFLVAHSSRRQDVRKARKDQGILIASGLMAGAAISGILSAVLRMKEIGAPVRFLSIGREFTLKDGQLVHTDASWYATSGLLAGVILIIALAVICFLVARYGARSVLAGEAMARQGIPPTEDPELGEEADPEDLFGDLDRDEEEDPGEEDDRY